jgi:WD40 repeat protein
MSYSLRVVLQNPPPRRERSGDDQKVRIWDPADGTEKASPRGHTDWVRSVCSFTEHGRTLLASGGDDRTVRIWDPATATAVQAIPVHHLVEALDYGCGSLVVAVTTGLLAIQLDPASVSHNRETIRPHKLC